MLSCTCLLPVGQVGRGLPVKCLTIQCYVAKSSCRRRLLASAVTSGIQYEPPDSRRFPEGTGPPRFPNDSPVISEPLQRSQSAWFGLVPTVSAWMTAVAALVALALGHTRNDVMQHCASDRRCVEAAVTVAPERVVVSPRAVVGHRPAVFASLSASQLLKEQSDSFSEALSYANYKILQAMTLPTWGKVLTVLAVALPILGVGSAALCVCSGLNPAAAVVRCYYILNNVPGADITAEENPRAALVLNLLYTVGLLTFAVLIGVLGDDIGSAVEAARLGNSRVPERNHTVVLGHNRQLFEVLRQVAHVRRDRGDSAFPGALVVLSPLGRPTLERLLLEALGPAAAGRVVTRQGSPLKVADLQRVSAGQARTVILLAPDQGDEAAAAAAAAAAAGGVGSSDGSESSEVARPDAVTTLPLSLEAQQAVTLAALHHLRVQALDAPGGSSLRTTPQTVVVQHDADVELPDPSVYGKDGGRGLWEGGAGAGGQVQAGGAPAAPQGTTSPGAHAVIHVSHLISLARVQAQCAAQHGLSSVMVSIMQQQPDNPEFYVQHVPEAVGLSYGQARRLFPTAVLCGVYDPSASASATVIAASASAAARLDAEASAVVLNPPDSLPLLERYSLILLADSAADLRVSQLPQQRKEQKQLRLEQQSQVKDEQQQQQQQTAATTTTLTTQQPPAGVWQQWNGATAGEYDRASGGGGGEGHLAERLVGRLRRHFGGNGCARYDQGAAPVRVVVLMFSDQSPEELLDALEDYCPPGSEAVVVVSREADAAAVAVATRSSSGSGSSISGRMQQQQQQQQRLRVSALVCDPRARGSLILAGAPEADAIILAGLEDVPTDQADAQALATLLQLQSLMPVQAPAGGAPTASTHKHPLSPPSSSPSPFAPSDAGGGGGHWAGSGERAGGGSEIRPLNFVCSVTDSRIKDIMASLVSAHQEPSQSSPQLQPLQPAQPSQPPQQRWAQQGGPGRLERQGAHQHQAQQQQALLRQGQGQGQRRRVTLETINADQLLAGVLTQVAAEPRLSGLFHELSSAQGVEVNLLTPYALGLPYDQELGWDQIQDAGRDHDSTVIGILRARGGSARADGGDARGGGGGAGRSHSRGGEGDVGRHDHDPRLQLGVPPGRSPLVLHPGDKLAVLSRD